MKLLKSPISAVTLDSGWGDSSNPNRCTAILMGFIPISIEMVLMLGGEIPQI